jgi:YidC/Oxa1 family membrane protein insertase
MELQRTRMILLVSLVIVAMILFGEWQKAHLPVHTPVSESESVSNNAISTDIPREDYSSLQKNASTAVHVNESVKYNNEDLLHVETDVYRISIATKGGDILKAELKDYPEKKGDNDNGVSLLNNSDARFYIAQTGLMAKNELGPDSAQQGRAVYHSPKQEFQLQDGENEIIVPLTWQHKNGVKVTKEYRFQRGSYLVGVSYNVENPTPDTWVGSFYGQAKRQWSKESKASGILGAQMYQGAALYTKDKPYKKVSFSDMKAGSFSQQVDGGWAAFLERYFLCAWIPDESTQQRYFTQVDGENTYKIGTISSFEVLPNHSKTVSGQWYIGPEVLDNLKGVAPGLELTIDYGILWPISHLLFWGLKNIHKFIGNWGWSIILLTMFVKLAFYKLSATSYRSMGKMRKLQPKIEVLKAQCKDDKQKFSQSMLELYRKEKVNPLGGCLPILIQIPVFIALYYVLLESVELRQAPFMLWVTDLSAKDPYYVLPLIMGASMFLQQRMNPAPPDPIQAKVMMLMPLVFTVLFLSFPAGLVLYWVANNVLSILQQWYILRSLEKAG